MPLIFLGCAATSRETLEEARSLSFTDISAGLPVEGLWRENLVLYDMNGDGSLDIVAPPPRKAKEGWKRPFIFLWDGPGKKWIESKHDFPAKGYDYGGIAVGDLNGDGRADIALAQHSANIALFVNDGKGFAEARFPVKEEFHSRAIVFSDINGDGRLDIVAVSEAPFSGNYEPRGILVGINKEGGDWDVRFPDESRGLFGDSAAVGDLRGSGNKDIAIAHLTLVKEVERMIWFGDGKGNFRGHTGDFFSEDVLPVIARTCDVDGDGRDEAAFGVALTGGGLREERGRLAVLKWTEDRFRDISSGLDLGGYLVAFDLADIDGDGRCELLALTETGIHLYKYSDTTGWSTQGKFPVPMTELSNVTDLKAGRNKDGSVVIVYNLGKYENPELKMGIKAYMLK